MDQNPLIRKLLIKPNAKWLLTNAPAGFAESLAPLPDGASLTTLAAGSFDGVILFVRTKGDLAGRIGAGVMAIAPGAPLWIAYPKGTSGIQTDLTRDKGFEPAREAGLRRMMLISIDETWSGVRFKLAPPEPGEDPGC